MVQVVELGGILSLDKICLKQVLQVALVVELSNLVVKLILLVQVKLVKVMVVAEVAVVVLILVVQMVEEAGKTWESVVNQAQRHNEELAGLFKNPATFPSSGSAGFEPETTEMVDQLIEDAKSYSQSWTGYLAGLEKRQAAFLKGLPETNSKIVESNQELAKSAAVYSEAFFQLSRNAAKGVSTKTKS